MKIQIELDPKQIDFINSKTKFLLFSGGVGAGKSWALIFKTIKIMLEHPGIHGLITDSNWPSLRDTTYSEFQELVPDRLVKNHNRTIHQFEFINGSRVTFRAFDNPVKLKRYTLGFIGHEELCDQSFELFKIARTRLRQPGYPGYFFGVTNPSVLENWVYKTFIENPIENSETIFSASYENTFLDKNYIQDLTNSKNTDESYYNRMVLGEWGSIEGLVYKLPFDQRKLPERFNPNFFIAGLDFGFKNPSVLSVIGLQDRVYGVMDEMCKRNLTSSDLISICLEYQKKYDFYKIYCDSARPEIIEEMCQAGLPAMPSVKGAGSVFSRIMYVKGLISNNELYINSTCRQHFREFDSYVWSTPTSRNDVSEKPLKLNDHAMDAMGYALHSYALELDKAGSDELYDFQKMLA